MIWYDTIWYIIYNITYHSMIIHTNYSVLWGEHSCRFRDVVDPIDTETERSHIPKRNVRKYIKNSYTQIHLSLSLSIYIYIYIRVSTYVLITKIVNTSWKSKRIRSRAKCCVHTSSLHPRSQWGQYVSFPDMRISPTIWSSVLLYTYIDINYYYYYYYYYCYFYYY